MLRFAFESMNMGCAYQGEMHLRRANARVAHDAHVTSCDSYADYVSLLHIRLSVNIKNAINGREFATAVGKNDAYYYI